MAAAPPDYSTLLYDRTRRLVGEPTIERLRSACVLVAGCGGVGGATAVLLARMGISRFVLADPGRFDPPDANRQWGADTTAMGANKAERHAEIIARINPDARVEVIAEGVTRANVAGLVEPADVVVDGLDLSVDLDLRAALFAEARRREAYCVSSPAVGFGSLIVASSPTGMAMDPFVALLESLGRRGLPATMARFFAPSTLESLNRELPQGKVPSIAIGPALCAAYSSTEVLVALTARGGRGLRGPLCLPQVLVIDSLAMSHQIVTIDELQTAMAGSTGAESAAPARVGNDGAGGRTVSAATYHRSEPIAPEEVDRLLRAAAWAPSGDNIQPWRFDWVPERRALEVVLDPDRDRSPMNAGQQMSLIACGAALENACRVAEARGWRTEVETPVPASLEAPTCVARLVLVERRPAVGSPQAELAITERVTNRRRYDRRPIGTELQLHLEQSVPDLPGMQVCWLFDRAVVASLADRIAATDAVMFAEPSMRHAFLGNVRFDLPPDAVPDERLSLGSLEAGPVDRLALRVMQIMPDRLFALSGGARMLGAYSRTLVRSSSGLTLVVPRDGQDSLTVGRAAQRVWLSLTEIGLAAQPMMSAPGLAYGLTHGSPGVVRSLEGLGAPAALRAFEQTLASAGVPGMPGFILRFGYAPAPTCRVGRRGLS